MFAYPDQLSAATKSQLESQMAVFAALSGKAFESLEQMMELNIAAAKSALDESGANLQHLLASKDAQEALAMSASQLQPSADRFIAYSRQLASISSSAQAEFAKTAEEQISEANRKTMALVEEIGKSAPPGTENIVNLMKSALGNTNAGYEQFSKTVKQAVEAAEMNMNTMTAQFAQSGVKTNPRASGAKRQG